MKKGICPKCRFDLDYGGYEVQDDSVRWDVWCACGFTGVEWYDIKFSGITDDYGNEVEGEKTYNSYD